METKFSVSGVEGTLKAFENLADQIGDKRKSSQILVNSVRQAMKPVLSMAKGLVAKDTGALDRSLGITARRPTRKDMKSNYVKPTDSAIALVSTKPIPAKLKQQFHAGGDFSAKAKRKFYRDQGSFYDGRAIANEFGTSKRSAKPFLRISLETQQSMVTNLLGMILNKNIQDAANKLNTQQQGK